MISDDGNLCIIIEFEIDWDIDVVVNDVCDWVVGVVNDLFVEVDILEV